MVLANRRINLTGRRRQSVASSKANLRSALRGFLAIVS
jgi:hypothetical protein